MSELAQYKTKDDGAPRADAPVLGITGCMAEHLKGTIRERAPYVDLVIGPDGYRRLLAHVEEARSGRAVDDTKLDRFEDVGFAALLRAVAAVDGIERVRFTSPYPLDFADDVVSAIAETPKICKHVHLPLQSGSDAVLARMRRGYDFATFRALHDKLRAVPGVAITTDLLIGFCDESDDEFAATLRAQEELRFDSAFTFAYSEREGTTAARKMPDTVPAETKQRRLAEVIARQQKITGEIMAAQIGKRERVLVEQRSKRSAAELMARTDAFRTVIIPAVPGVAPGALVDVTIARATIATLFGVLA